MARTASRTPTPVTPTAMVASPSSPCRTMMRSRPASSTAQAGGTPGVHRQCAMCRRVVDAHATRLVHTQSPVPRVPTMRGRRTRWPRR
eukprot:2910364-Alexandrium_andersonii.AAC.1